MAEIMAQKHAVDPNHLRPSWDDPPSREHGLIFIEDVLIET